MYICIDLIIKINKVNYYLYIIIRIVIVNENKISFVSIIKMFIISSITPQCGILDSFSSFIISSHKFGLLSSSTIIIDAHIRVNITNSYTISITSCVKYEIVLC